VILELNSLNPLKWTRASAPLPSVVPQRLATPIGVPSVACAFVSVKAVTSQEMAAVENEVAMSTAAVVADVSAVPVATVVPHQKAGFVRFIDKVGGFFVRHEGAIEQAAVDAEAVLALTPFGPEYDLVVNAIVGIRRMASASKSAGVAISGPDQMKKVVEAVTPGLVNILVSKNVIDNHDVHIANYTQVLFDLLSGPTVGPAASTAAKA
jgi:hypothetical protein